MSNEKYYKIIMKTQLSTLCMVTILISCSLDKIEAPSITPSPVACFTAHPQSCEMGCTVTFDASCSKNVIDYKWDFDGDDVFDLIGRDSIVAHTYDVADDYIVKLVVENAAGSNQTSSNVLINSAPPSFELGQIVGNNCSDLPCNIKIETTTENVDSIQWIVTLEDTSYHNNVLSTTFIGNLDLDIAFTNHGTYTVSATAFGADTTITQSSNDVISLVPYTFMGSYDSKIGTNEDRFYLMELDENGDVIVTGWTPDIGSNAWDIGIWRIDNEGQVLNMEQTGGSKVDEPYGLIKSINGDFILSGFIDNPQTKGYVAGFDKSFVEKFNPVIITTYKTVYDLTEDPDGNYVIFGATNSDELELLEVKSNGVIFANPWKFTFAADKKLGYLSDSELLYFEGSFYVMYFERNNSSLYRIPFKASSSTVVSPKIINISRARVLRLMNKKLFVGGSNILFVDLDGSELARNENFSCEGADLALDGNIITISYENSLTLRKVDQELNVLWEKEIGDGIYTNLELAPQDVRVGSDGSIYVCGYYAAEDFTSNGFLLRTDSNGNVLDNFDL